MQAFGWYTAAHATACAISNSVDFDKIGSVVAPAALAAYALNLMPVPTLAVGLLGFYLSRELEVRAWHLIDPRVGGGKDGGMRPQLRGCCCSGPRGGLNHGRMPAQR